MHSRFHFLLPWASKVYGVAQFGSLGAAVAGETGVGLIEGGAPTVGS
jgi:hypothetical protein